MTSMSRVLRLHYDNKDQINALEISPEILKVVEQAQAGEKILVGRA